MIGLHVSVTGITLVALGTSMPDTFASMAAASHDDTADAAIGNVTGNFNFVPLHKGYFPWLMYLVKEACHHVAMFIHSPLLSPHCTVNFFFYLLFPLLFM